LCHSLERSEVYPTTKVVSRKSPVNRNVNLRFTIDDSRFFGTSVRRNGCSMHIQQPGSKKLLHFIATFIPVKIMINIAFNLSFQLTRGKFFTFTPLFSKPCCHFGY
jgi:hypothetical protein